MLNCESGDPRRGVSVQSNSPSLILQAVKLIVGAVFFCRKLRQSLLCCVGKMSSPAAVGRGVVAMAGIVATAVFGFCVPIEVRAGHPQSVAAAPQLQGPRLPPGASGGDYPGNSFAANDAYQTAPVSTPSPYGFKPEVVPPHHVQGMPPAMPQPTGGPEVAYPVSYGVESTTTTTTAEPTADAARPGHTGYPVPRPSLFITPYGASWAPAVAGAGESFYTGGGTPVAETSEMSLEGTTLENDMMEVRRALSHRQKALKSGFSLKSVLKATALLAAAAGLGFQVYSLSQKREA